MWTRRSTRICRMTSCRSQTQKVSRPDVLIFEGLNVLQTPSSTTVASDFFDFSVYIDAAEADIEGWYIERFLLLQRTAFQKDTSFFHRYKDLSEAEARVVAHDIWSRINLRNLRENIFPTRQRARLILRKRWDHGIGEIRPQGDVGKARALPCTPPAPASLDRIYPGGFRCCAADKLLLQRNLEPLPPNHHLHCEARLGRSSPGPPHRARRPGLLRPERASQ